MFVLVCVREMYDIVLNEHVHICTYEHDMCFLILSSVSFLLLIFLLESFLFAFITYYLLHITYY